MLINDFIKKYRSLSLLLTFLSYSAYSEALNERWYQERWCEQNNGQAEVVLDDGTRCDCITSNFAVEVDFARKWAESIGQSLHYSRMTGKSAGILLIITDANDDRYIHRLIESIHYHNLPIQVWVAWEKHGQIVVKKKI